MTWASVSPSSLAAWRGVEGAAELLPGPDRPTPPRPRKPAFMATLLTLELTRPSPESCGESGSGGSPEFVPVLPGIPGFEPLRSVDMRCGGQVHPRDLQDPPRGVAPPVKANIRGPGQQGERGSIRRARSPFVKMEKPWEWALNSAVECHLHTVEVIGSNPIAPTILEVPRCARDFARRLPPPRCSGSRRRNGSSSNPIAPTILEVPVSSPAVRPQVPAVFSVCSDLHSG